MLTRNKRCRESKTNHVELIDCLYFSPMNAIDCFFLSRSSFDLSDVAFCLLSRFNETFFHLPRQHSCSCHVHYLYQNLSSTSIIKYPTNYLRLTPICLLNETFEPSSLNDSQSSNRTDFLLQGLEDQCDYKLIFLDCDAMTTTTTTTTTLIPEFTTIDETTLIETTTEIPVSTTTPWFVSIFSRIFLLLLIFFLQGISNIPKHQNVQ